MKTMLVAAVLGLAACGGTQAFEGDTVVAELTNGQPSCSQGATGPTLHTSEVETTYRLNSLDPGVTYISNIVTCDWTCGNINGITKAFVHVVFYTDHTGAWVMDPHADPSAASCPQ